MQLISCHNGRIFTATCDEQVAIQRTFVTCLSALDELAPNGRFMRGAIHELLVDPSEGLPRFVAMMFARAAARKTIGGTDIPVGSLIRIGCRSTDLRHRQECLRHQIIWCDPTAELYPPAIAPFIPLEHLYLLHPKKLADESWAIAECLRCKGVGAVIAAPSRLSRIESRRLQLAAERGGGVGILLRHLDRGANVYAASTRWLVSPCPGEPTVQKWKIQLIHGHGGRVGQAVILEHHRETNLVRATEQLVDRSVSAPTAIRASA